MLSTDIVRARRPCGVVSPTCAMNAGHIVAAPTPSSADSARNARASGIVIISVSTGTLTAMPATIVTRRPMRSAIQPAGVCQRNFATP